MSMNVGLPFNPQGYETALRGIRLGDRFFDNRGRSWKVYALSNDLTSNTLTVNNLCFVADTNVTYPTDCLFDYTTTTGVSPFLTATNTVANALDYAAGAPIIAVCAGIADATIAEAASAAAADIRYVLLMTEGPHLVTTSGGDDFTRGDHAIIAGNGTVSAVAGTDTTAETRGTQRSHVGWALAADEDTDNLVYLMVDVGKF